MNRSIEVLSSAIALSSVEIINRERFFSDWHSGLSSLKDS